MRHLTICDESLTMMSLFFVLSFFIAKVPYKTGLPLSFIGKYYFSLLQRMRNINQIIYSNINNSRGQNTSLVFVILARYHKLIFIRIISACSYIMFLYCYLVNYYIYIKTNEKLDVKKNRKICTAFHEMQHIVILLSPYIDATQER